MLTCRAVVFFCMRGRWKTQGRGTGSQGVENQGCGKIEASVKNTRKPLFRSMNFPHHHEKSKFVISNWKENQLAWNAFLDHESALTISGEKKTFKCQRARCNGFSLYVVAISFFTVTCVDLVLTLKKMWILKIVLLSIFYREKRQLPYLLDWKPVTWSVHWQQQTNNICLGSRAEFQTKVKVGYKWRKCSNHVEIPVPKYFLVFFRKKRDLHTVL